MLLGSTHFAKFSIIFFNVLTATFRHSIFGKIFASTAASWWRCQIFFGFCQIGWITNNFHYK